MRTHGLWPLFVVTSVICGGCTAETLRLGSMPIDGGSGEPSMDAGMIFADAGLVVDAEPIVDAGQLRGRDYWTLEEKEAYLRVIGFGFVTDGTAFIRVEMYPDHVCEHSGPIEVEQIGSEMFRVRAHMWLDHASPPGRDPCFGITDQSVRDVPIEGLTAGQWTFIEQLSGSTVTIEVGPRPDCMALPGECSGNCDCPARSKCIACAGNGVCVGQCGRICNPVRTGCCGSIHPYPELECPPEQRCQGSVSEGHASGSCVPLSSDACRADTDCPAGMSCPVTDSFRECAWFTLGARSRHSCRTNGDCDPGLVCVEAGAARTRRCEVPCFTSRMRCPRAHICQAQSAWDARWVCEWIGE